MNYTESNSNYHNLEKMSVRDLLISINEEDKTVPESVARIIPVVEKLVVEIVTRMKEGGRLFYIGAGTSGRLAVLDASECPPTFGVSPDTVIGIIAGGDLAIRKAVEFAEDDKEQAWKDLQLYNITKKDVLVGIAASGRTPYVIGGVQEAKKNNILTACITCNTDTELAKNCDIPIEIIVGAEFLTGSTRMKAGTAQKLILNMISTSVMIQLGKVKNNKMVDMQLSNHKLVERGIKMIMDDLKVDYQTAGLLLEKFGSVRKVLENH